MDETVRFQPVPAWETPEAVDALQRSSGGRVDRVGPFLPDSMFVWTSVHPPSMTGMATQANLLTLLLLCRSGYFVGKYISLERLADSKETYYEACRRARPDGMRAITIIFQPYAICWASWPPHIREFAYRVDILVTKGLIEAR